MKKYIPLEPNEIKVHAEKATPTDYAKELKNYYYEKERYYPVEQALLLPESQIAFTIYTTKALRFQPLFEASESLLFRLPQKMPLTEGGYLIKESDIFLYNEYLKSIDEPLELHKSDSRRNAALIKEKSKLVIKNMLSQPRNAKNMKEVASVVDEMTHSIMNDSNILYNLLTIKTHDYYTYTHCVNVAVLSIGLGVSIGLEKTEISKLAFGAILHDIGKISISVEILNKIGELTPIEKKIMQNHAIEGIKILSEQHYLPPESLSVVAQHHEKLSGAGYPLKLTGAKISKLAKICAITDMYDLLTTERPGEIPLTTFDALSLIIEECEHYDSEYLISFIKIFGSFH